MADVVAAQAALDQASASLVEAKTQCSDGCADGTVHEAHRATLEAAYANFAAASRTLADAQIDAGIAAPAGPPAATTTVTTAEPADSEGGQG